MSTREADDKAPKFGQSKPERHLPFQYAAIGFRGAGAAALSGDHEHDARAAALRSSQERKQRPVGFGLSLAMQVETRVEGGPVVYTLLDPLGARIFGMAEVLELLGRRPELRSLNAGIRRNEGLERSRARDFVEPGGGGQGI